MVYNSLSTLLLGFTIVDNPRFVKQIKNVLAKIFLWIGRIQASFDKQKESRADLKVLMICTCLLI